MNKKLMYSLVLVILVFTCITFLFLKTSQFAMTLPKNLQQQNFEETLLKMQGIPGWEIVKNETFCALKSPATSPLINLVWGQATEENLLKARQFFKNQQFYWILTEEQDDLALINAGFKKPILFPEMILPLNDYTCEISSSPHITVIQAQTPSQLQQWLEVASVSLDISPEDLGSFFLPLIQNLEYIPYLALYDDEPAATGLVFCGAKEAGIYCMTTHPKFRRKGLASACLGACLQTAKQHNLSYAVLYSSTMGTHLYKEMGFKTVQTLKEYHWDTV